VIELVKFFKVVLQIAILFSIYYIGVFIQDYFQLFIPGSVIGLILLFLLLVTGILQSKWIEDGARFMLNHLVLFFIPATVGILNYYEIFIGKGIFLIIITIVSTLFVMVSSGYISEFLSRKKVPQLLKKD